LGVVKFKKRKKKLTEKGVEESSSVEEASSPEQEMSGIEYVTDLN